MDDDNTRDEDYSTREVRNRQADAVTCDDAMLIELDEEPDDE